MFETLVNKLGYFCTLQLIVSISFQWFDDIIHEWILSFDSTISASWGLLIIVLDPFPTSFWCRVLTVMEVVRFIGWTFVTFQITILWWSSIGPSYVWWCSCWKGFIMYLWMNYIVSIAFRIHFPLDVSIYVCTKPVSVSPLYLSSSIVQLDRTNCIQKSSLSKFITASPTNFYTFFYYNIISSMVLWQAMIL